MNSNPFLFPVNIKNKLLYNVKRFFLAIINSLEKKQALTRSGPTKRKEDMKM